MHKKSIGSRGEDGQCATLPSSDESCELECSHDLAVARKYPDNDRGDQQSSSEEHGADRPQQYAVVADQQMCRFVVGDRTDHLLGVNDSCDAGHTHGDGVQACGRADEDGDPPQLAQVLLAQRVVVAVNVLVEREGDDGKADHHYRNASVE